MFQSSDSPIYQLKNITQKSMEKWWELNECSSIFRKILNKESLKSSTEDINIESYVLLQPYFQH
jgi:hypothetical protein